MIPRKLEELGRVEYPVLLVALLAQFLLAPWTEASPVVQLAFTGVQVLVWLAAWRALRPHRVLLPLALVLGALNLVLRNVEGTPHLLTSLLDLTFLACLLLAILLDVFRAKRVNSDTLSGAGAVYLLVGLIWAVAYDVVLHHDPQAFRAGDAPVEAAGDLVYFSFVVLTTLGFGDVVPVSAEARSLAMSEALIGQLYLVVFMARLVALSLQPSGPDPSDADAGPPA